MRAPRSGWASRSLAPRPVQRQSGKSRGQTALFVRNERNGMGKHHILLLILSSEITSGDHRRRSGRRRVGRTKELRHKTGNGHLNGRHEFEGKVCVFARPKSESDDRVLFCLPLLFTYVPHNNQRVPSFYSAVFPR